MANKHGDFVWYEFMSREPEKARDFYQRVAGLSVPEQSDTSGEVDYRMIAAPDGVMGGLLVLTEEMCAHGARPGWLGYIAVDDVDESLREVKKGGGKVLLPARDLPNVGRIAMVQDLHGAVFYLMRGFSEEPSHVFRTGQPGYVGWNELTGLDQAASFEFYHRLLGWNCSEMLDMGEEVGTYLLFEHHGQVLGGIMSRFDEQQPVAWTYYIGVADIDHAFAQIEPAGGRVYQPPMEVPGGDFIAIGLDGEGALFCLVGPRNA